MNRNLAPIVVCISLVTGQLFAQDHQGPPSPSSVSDSPIGAPTAGPNGAGLFIGHYGEAFAIPYGWTAEAELHGATETVYIHRKSHDDFGLQPFRPQPSDYKLENFARLGLLELIVVPKNIPGGLRSLSDIRAAKEKELKSISATFRIDDANDADSWPPQTFHVGIQHPYRILQTYTESPSEFFILTAGQRLQSGEYGLTDARMLDYENTHHVVSSSLGNSLRTMQGRTVLDRFFRSSPTPSSLLPISIRVPILVGFSLLTMIILALFPGRSERRAKTRLFGRSMLLFSLSSALTGFLSVYLPNRFGGVIWRNPEDALALAALATPLISWGASALLGSFHKGRVLAVTFLLTAAWVAILIFGPRTASDVSTSEMLIVGSLTPFLTGIIFASAFALAFGPAVDDFERPR